MSGSIKTRSIAKGNEATRGDTSAAPDNPGNLRIREERGHKACALSYNTTTMQMFASSSSHRSMELGQNQSSSALSEQPWHGRTTSNEPRMMQTTALLMFDDYGAGNSPNTSGMSYSDPMTSNDARMVQSFAPSSLLSDNDAVPTGSGTAMFQNVKTTRMFALLSSIGYDKPGDVEDSPTLSFCPSSPAGTQQQGMGGPMGLPLHEMEQGFEGKGQAMSLWSSSHYEWRTDIGDAATVSQESNGLSQTAA